jgi:hypothetical protein
MVVAVVVAVAGNLRDAFGLSSVLPQLWRTQRQCQHHGKREYCGAYLLRGHGFPN